MNKYQKTSKDHDMAWRREVRHTFWLIAALLGALIGAIIAK